MNPRIVALAPVDRSGLRVRLTLEDGTWWEVATEAVERSGVGLGDPVDDALRARLADDDLRCQIREAAMTLIARRPWARQELRRRLLGKRFPAPLVDACLEALEAQRLVDDGAFARSFVRDRLRLRPRGRRRLSQEMREKGIDPATIGRALSDVFAEEQVHEDALARDAALGWVARQRPEARLALAQGERTAERERALRRLSGFLARRGFSGDSARDALEAAAEAARSGAKPERS